MAEYIGSVPYPEYLRQAGFRFVERMHPKSDKIGIRQQSAVSKIPEEDRLSTGQFQNIIHNQTNAFNIANEDQIQRGLAWYETANRIAESLHPDIETAGGVIAALSGSGGEWVKNVRNAESFIKTGKLPYGTVGDNVEKAQKILEGEHYTTVLPKGLKEANFARVIINPNDPHAVAVDTQHYDASTGLKMPWKEARRGLESQGRYNTIADATRMVAERKGLLPNQLQAIDWLVWKELGHPYRGHPRAIDIYRRFK